MQRWRHDRETQLNTFSARPNVECDVKQFRETHQVVHVFVSMRDCDECAAFAESTWQETEPTMFVSFETLKNWSPMLAYWTRAAQRGPQPGANAAQ